MAKNQNNNVAPATQKTEPGAKKDALATALAQIEKQFGKGAIMKLGDNTAMQVDAISTGSLGLDLALGVGGVPRGRIIEVFGPESSGKTTLALHILAEAQKKGGEVAFIDVEHALDPAYASALGVNIDELLVSQPDTGEQAMEICEALVRSGAIDAIVVDSVAAMVPRAEIEGEMGDSYVGLQARLMSQALRKLTGAIGIPDKETLDKALSKTIEEESDDDIKDDVKRNVYSTDLSALSVEELKKLKANANTRLCRARNMLLYSSEKQTEKENPLPECPKRVKYEKKVEQETALIERIDYRLAELG